jgi:putative phosphoribosyl transferase
VTARFADRRAAGRHLAAAVARAHLHDPVVLALPRGGVPVAFEVALALAAPLDVVVARKVGAPGHPELGIGAIAEGGVHVARADALAAFGLDDGDFERLAAGERDELERRVARYRQGRPLPALRGRDAVVVDDGLATGVTAHAALLAVAALAPARLVMAAPVCAPGAGDTLGGVADEVVCPDAAPGFVAVGDWYDDFTQTTDAEVTELLERARAAAPSGDGSR